MPRVSITFASGGTAISDRRPTAAIRSPAMRTTPSEIGGPSYPSMTCPPTRASVTFDSAPPGEEGDTARGEDEKRGANLHFCSYWIRTRPENPSSYPWKNSSESSGHFQQ